MDLKKLLSEFPDHDKYLPFHGVDNNKFKLGGYIFEVLEDESDGYRSCLETVRRTYIDPDRPWHDGHGDMIAFRKPIAKCRVTDDRQYGQNVDDEFLHLIDENGHVWLTFGTSNTDDYYPCFRFEYKPRAA